MEKTKLEIEEESIPCEICLQEVCECDPEEWDEPTGFCQTGLPESYFR